MSTRLTAEQVAVIQRRYKVNVAQIGSGETRWRDSELVDLCDSHESLRAELVEAQKTGRVLKLDHELVQADLDRANEIISELRTILRGRVAKDVPREGGGIGHVVYGHVFKSYEERAEAAERALTVHLKAVGDFMNELYAIMVDPCAEGTISVDEMKAALLSAAIRDREAEHTLTDAQQERDHAIQSRDAWQKSLVSTAEERDALQARIDETVALLKTRRPGESIAGSPWIIATEVLAKLQPAASPGDTRGQVAPCRKHVPAASPGTGEKEK